MSQPRRPILLVAPLLLGAGCTAMPKLHFNEPPSTPTVAIEPAAPTTTDTLTAVVVAEATDAEGDALTYHYTWLIDGVSVGTSPTLAPSSTTRGQVVTVQVAAGDGEFTGEPGEASVTILNSAPTGSTTSISPANPLTADDLTVAVDAQDADGELLTWSIRWLRDGTDVPTYSDVATVPASATGSGQSWSVEATPSDGAVAGPTATASVRVDDTAPELASLVVGPSDVKHGETLGVTASGATDVDGDALTVHYAWFVNGVVVAEHDSGTSDVLTTDISRGDVVTVSGYASDGQLNSSTVTSNAVTVSDSAPTLGSVILSPDPGHESDTLTCTPTDGDDVDGDTVRYTYAWQVDGSAVSGSTSTLTGSSFSRGDTVACQVTPYDDGATGARLTSNTVAVENALPSISSVTLSPTTATAGTTLSSTVTGWYDADGDSERLAYSWVVDGTVSANTSTLADLLRGEAIYLEVTPNDGYANGTPVRSAVLTVANAAPRLTGVSISPSVLYIDSAPAAVPSGFSDADGDSPIYRYQWYLDGSASSGETGASLLSPLSIGQQVQVRVWPGDGISEGTNVASSALTVQDRAPVAMTELLTPEPIQTCDSIQLSAAGSTDADGDVLDYSWTVSTRPAGAHRTTSDLDTATDEQPWFIVDADGAWTFRVQVSDGSLTDTEDLIVDVEPRGYNSAPIADAGPDQATGVDAACSTSSGYGTSCVPCPTVDFNLSALASTDADGDPLDYEWTMAPTSYVSLTGSDTGTPVLSIGGMVPVYDTTTTVSVTLTVGTTDCAEGSSTDSVTVTYECMGI